MSIMSLIVTLVVVGVIMYAINRWVPMEPNIKKILNIAVVVCLVLWLLLLFFGRNALDMPVPQVGQRWLGGDPSGG